MRSIEARFNKVAKKEPKFSSYLLLAHAVRGQKFSRESLGVALGKLVNKDDFNLKDKRELISHIASLSNQC